jgi:Tfp pilus assembly protein PilN
MIKVNLLPPHLQEKGKKAKKNALALVLAIIIILITSGGIIVLFGFQHTLNTEVNKIKKDLQAQEEKNVSYSEIEQKVSSLNNKLNAIKSLQQNRIYWSSLLKELALCTPTDVQITQFSVSKQEQERKISVKGIASSRRSVMKLKEELSVSTYFKAVDFVSSQLTDENNPSSPVDFTLTMYIK